MFPSSPPSLSPAPLRRRVSYYACCPLSLAQRRKRSRRYTPPLLLPLFLLAFSLPPSCIASISVHILALLFLSLRADDRPLLRTVLWRGGGSSPLTPKPEGGGTNPIFHARGGSDAKLRALPFYSNDGEYSAKKKGETPSEATDLFRRSPLSLSFRLSCLAF